MSSTTSKFRKKRLFKVSRELNVSVETIVGDLEEAGLADALTGTGLNAAITSEEAYDFLVEQYAEDKAIAARVKEKRAARDEALDDEASPSTQEAASAPEAEAEPDVETSPSEPVAEAPSESADELPADAGESDVTTEISDDVESEAALDAAEPAEADVVAAPESAADDTAVDAGQAETPEASTKATSEPSEDAEGGEAAVAPEEASKADDASVVESAPEPAAADIAAADGTDIDVEDAVDEPADDEETDSTIQATRYKLEGTKVLGKIDLSSVDKESGEGGRRRRKRKRKTTKATPATAAKTETEDRSSRKRKQKGRKRGGVVDESEVRATLQETLREIEQGASRSRQRRRRQRRDQHAADREREESLQAEQSSILRVTEYVSTGELANLLNVPVTEVISTLFSAGMMVSINQRLDADTIQFVADEYGTEVEFITEFGTDDIEIEEDAPEDLQDRAPVVTVMGHVDHGKTSLLDVIRSANVVAGEAGGITQHIGAYHVELPSGRSMTFLDTPGHEAFTAMRARGAKVTDVVVLVVAADDSVKPQTIEAINHARAADVPLVVAINKVDKPDANPQKVMQELADQNVLVEQYGGKVQCALVSAKTGDGVEDLTDRILLEADLLELKANPDRNAVGTIIEERLDKGRGVIATVLVQNGTLSIGDKFVAGIYSGSVRAMFDERDNRIDAVGPARPALVLGFDGAPDVGDQFIGLDDEREARDIAQKRQQIYREQSLRQRKHITLDEIGRRLALGDFRELNLIVKADVGGSVEAISDALLKLSTEEVAVNIIHTGVGAITESDVMLASASDAVIIAFQVRPMPSARALAEREEIDIRAYSIIYDAISDVRDALEGLLSPEKHEKTLGTAEVRETFKVPRVGTVAGCYVIDGVIKRNDRIRLIRDGVVIYEGGLASLKRFKDDVREVQSGYECGMGMENYDDIKVGDQFEAYEIVETKRTLEV